MTLVHKTIVLDISEERTVSSLTNRSIEMPTPLEPMTVVEFLAKYYQIIESKEKHLFQELSEVQHEFTSEDDFQNWRWNVPKILGMEDANIGDGLSLQEAIEDHTKALETIDVWFENLNGRLEFAPCSEDQRKVFKMVAESLAMCLWAYVLVSSLALYNIMRYFLIDEGEALLGNLYTQAEKTLINKTPIRGLFINVFIRQARISIQRIGLDFKNSMFDYLNAAYAVCPKIDLQDVNTLIWFPDCVDFEKVIPWLNGADCRGESFLSSQDSWEELQEIEMSYSSVYKSEPVAKRGRESDGDSEPVAKRGRVSDDDSEMSEDDSEVSDDDSEPMPRRRPESDESDEYSEEDSEEEPDMRAHPESESEEDERSDEELAQAYFQSLAFPQNPILPQESEESESEEESEEESEDESEESEWEDESVTGSDDQGTDSESETD